MSQTQSIKYNTLSAAKNRMPQQPIFLQNLGKELKTQNHRMSKRHYNNIKAPEYRSYGGYSYILNWP